MTDPMREAAPSRQTPRVAPIATALVTLAALVAMLASGAMGASGARAEISVVGSTKTRITVAWTKTANASGYSVYRGSKLLLRTPHTRVTLTNLSCGRRYTVAVRPFDWAHKVKFATTRITVPTRPCADTVAPTAPTRLTIARRTATSLSLTWRPSTDNVRVVSYRISVATMPLANAPKAESVSGALRSIVGKSRRTTYVVDGLACATTYKLSVQALDARGNRSRATGLAAKTGACGGAAVPPEGPAGTAPTEPTPPAPAPGPAAPPAPPTDPGSGGTAPPPPAPDTTAPSVPTALHTTAVAATSISLAWSGSTDNLGVTGYTASSNGVSAGTTPGTAYTVSGLACGTTYSFTVSAHDAAGNHSAASNGLDVATSACGGGADTAAPSVPTGLHSTATTTTTVALAWTASTDNVGVTGYTAYSNGADAGTGAGTSRTITGLTCGTSYAFTVDAYDAAGNHSTRTTALNVSTDPCPDTTPPSVPAGLHSTGATANSVSLAWTASTDDVGVTGYTTYRGGVSVGTGAGTSSTVAGLTCGTSYAFRVDAYDAAGHHSASSATFNTSTTACADTTAPSVPAGLHTTALTTTSVTLAWTASADNVGVSGYTTYRGGVSPGTGAGTSSTVTGLACGTSYAFAVDAYDAAGNHSARTATLNAATSACGDTTAPSVPAGLHSTAATTTSVSLAWTASTDNVGVTGYTTYSNGTAAGTGAGATYTVSSLTCGTSYAFTVDAYDAAGNHSARTATVNVATSACAGGGGGGARDRSAVPVPERL